MNCAHFLTRERCPVCDSASVDELYSCDYTKPPVKPYIEQFYSSQGKIEFDLLENASFTLDGCNRCGLVYQRHVPDDFLLHKVYEEWIDPRLALERHQESGNVADIKSRAIELWTVLAYCGKLAGQPAVLDFGMGWGNWCALAQALGCKAYGTELSQARIEHVEESGVTVIGLDEVSRHRFDFIYSNAVFEHLVDPPAVLKTLRNSLAEGGMIQLNVPDGANVRKTLSAHGFDWAAPDWSAPGARGDCPVSPLEHINSFDRHALVRMGEVCGLRTVDIPASKQFVCVQIGKGGLIKSLAKTLVQNRRKTTNVLFQSDSPRADDCRRPSRGGQP